VKRIRASLLQALLDDAEPATLVIQDLSADGYELDDLFSELDRLEASGLIRILWMDEATFQLSEPPRSREATFTTARELAQDGLAGGVASSVEAGMWLELTHAGRAAAMSTLAMKPD
jgi:hypothetical protein